MYLGKSSLIKFVLLFYIRTMLTRALDSAHSKAQDMSPLVEFESTPKLEIGVLSIMF